MKDRKFIRRVRDAEEGNWRSIHQSVIGWQPARIANFPCPHEIKLEVDQTDYDDIQKAIAKRQAIRVMTDTEGGNIPGNVIAEICRGWLDRFDCDGFDESLFKAGSNETPERID